MKKVILILSGLILAGCLGLIALFFSIPWLLDRFEPSAEEYLSEFVLSPTPANTKVTELYYHNPLLGDSGLLVELELTDEGMKELLSSHTWTVKTYSTAFMLRSHQVIQEKDNYPIYGKKLSDAKSIEMVVKGDRQAILAVGASYD